MLATLHCEILEAIGRQSLESIISMLDHPDGDVRKFIADILGNIGDMRAVPKLTEKLNDSDKNVVTSAIESLGKLRDERSTDALLGALNGPFTFECALSLGKIGSGKAIVPLMDIAKDKKSLARFAAIEAIGQIQHKYSIPKLLLLLEDKDTTLQKTVLKAIGEIDRNWLENAIIQEASLWNTETFLSALDDEDADLRRYAIIALGALNLPEGNSKLISMLESDDEDQTSFIVHSLVKIARVNLELLIQALKSDKYTVRRAIALVLGDAQKNEAVPHLVRLAEDPNPVVRIAAMRALGKLPMDAPPEIMLRALNDDEEMVRKSACDALGWIGDKRATEGLSKCMGDESAEVADSAMGALVMIGGTEVRKMLTESAKENSPRMRKQAITALAFIGGPDALTSMKFAMNDESSEVRIAALNGLAKYSNSPEIENIIKLSLSDKNPKIRIAALLAISKALRANALPSLILALEDTDIWVRVRAVKCMTDHKNEQTAETLIRLFPKQPTMVQTAICDALGSFEEQRAQSLPFLCHVSETYLRANELSVKNAALKAVDKLIAGKKEGQFNGK